ALAKATVTIGTNGFAVTDYPRVRELVELGRQSAAAQSAALLPYAIQDPTEWQQYLSARAARRRRPPENIEAIQVVGSDSDTDDRIQHRLSKALRGPLDLSNLDRQLIHIAGEGKFVCRGNEALRKTEF